MTTTADTTGLLAAILANPDDDTLRLVYADAIEETDAERAAFIRLQIRLSELARQEPAKCGAVVGSRHAPTLCEHCRWSYEIQPLSEAQFGYVKRNKEAWVPVPIDKPWAYIGGAIDTCRIGVRDTFGVSFEYRRGFAESVMCEYSWWAKYAERLRESCSLTAVVLTTFPVLVRNARGEYAVRDDGFQVVGRWDVVRFQMGDRAGRDNVIAPLLSKRWPWVGVRFADYARSER